MESCLFLRVIIQQIVLPPHQHHHIYWEVHITTQLCSLHTVLTIAWNTAGINTTLTFWNICQFLTISPNLSPEYSGRIFRCKFRETQALFVLVSIHPAAHVQTNTWELLILNEFDGWRLHITKPWMLATEAPIIQMRKPTKCRLYCLTAAHWPDWTDFSDCVVKGANQDQFQVWRVYMEFG